MDTIENVTKDDVISLLQEVKDPEIPRVSVVELGMITGIEISSDNKVEVRMTPTFAGCPAVEILKSEIKNKVLELPVEDVEVKVDYDIQWSTDMITEEGRRHLKESGFALPAHLNNELISIDLLTNVECPFCGSKKTRLRNPFGPTLCRAIHYCDACSQAFEQFKPV
ncbi:MAG: phenylacetate-CoA oxygenase subunit PaaJ [Bacteroidetes bacterium]|nr:phenylacetate-CoA oxygenase subunit PaaJ [Bacteroidota bacterium]